MDNAPSTNVSTGRLSETDLDAIERQAAKHAPASHEILIEAVCAVARRLERIAVTLERARTRGWSE